MGTVRDEALKPIDVSIPHAWVKVGQEAVGLGKATDKERDIVRKWFDDGCWIDSWTGLPCKKPDGGTDLGSGD